MKQVTVYFDVLTAMYMDDRLEMVTVGKCHHDTARYDDGTTN